MSFSFSCLLIPFPVSYSVSSAVSASVSSPISCSFLHFFLLFPVSFLVWYKLTSAGLDVRACSPHCVLNVNELDEGLLTLSLGAVFDGWMRRRVSAASFDLTFCFSTGSFCSLIAIALTTFFRAVKCSSAAAGGGRGGRLGGGFPLLRLLLTEVNQGVRRSVNHCQKSQRRRGNNDILN